MPRILLGVEIFQIEFVCSLAPNTATPSNLRSLITLDPEPNLRPFSIHLCIVFLFQLLSSRLYNEVSLFAAAIKSNIDCHDSKKAAHKVLYYVCLVPLLDLASVCICGVHRLLTYANGVSMPGKDQLDSI